MDANLLSAMEATSVDNGLYKTRPALNDMIVYGRVRSLIKRPAMLPSSIVNGKGYFCIVDAYALRCLGTDYFADEHGYDINNIYFTRGSMLAFINSPDWVGKDVKLGGKYAGKGVTIRRQEFKGDDKTTGISIFVFNAAGGQGRTKTFELACNSISEIFYGCNESKGTKLEEFLLLLTQAGAEIPYSKTLESIVPYSGVEEYEVYSVGDEPEPSPELPAIKTSYKPDYLKPDGTVDISKIKMNLTYHLEGQPKSPLFEKFQEYISEREGARYFAVSDDARESKAGVFSQYGEVDYRDIATTLLSQFVTLLKYGSRPLPRSNARVKDFAKDFVENCDDATFSPKRLFTAEVTKPETIRVGKELLEKRIMLEPESIYGRTCTEIDSLPVLGSDIASAINVISTVSGISFDSFVSNFKYMERYYSYDNDEYFGMLLANPYLLGMASRGLSLVDCDIIYYGFSVPLIGKLEVAEDYRKMYLMASTVESICEGNYIGVYIKAGTFLPLRELKTVREAKYAGLSSRFIKENGFPAQVKYKEAIEIVVGKAVSTPAQSVMTGAGGKWFNSDTYELLLDRGVLAEMSGYVALEKTIAQEFIIYMKLYELGNTDTGISDEQIEQEIAEFEAKKGFKLEKLQADALKLCKKSAAVLSGCAGSGKTTTSDAMANLFKKHDKRKLVYCAPTGKAARRLAEVQGTNVKTIHSQFQVMLGGTPLMPISFRVKDNDRPSTDSFIYFMDEMAMCSTELLYHAVAKLSNKDAIYFYGDIKQLPPIGAGCPFALLMKLLPCVELGVSKRAAEGSLINYNVSMINFLSDGQIQPLRFDKSSFIGVRVGKDMIKTAVVRCFKRFMELGFTEDDIQVITGYQSDKFSSSTRVLNPPVQEFLRAKDKLLFKRPVKNPEEAGKLFYANERVIYVNRNNYDMCRYVYVGNQGGSATFVKVPTFGIVNGEMGKLVGVISADTTRFVDSSMEDFQDGGSLGCKLTEDDYKELIKAYEEREDTIRDDSKWSGEEAYFAVVQVYDSAIGHDVVVLLRGRISRGYTMNTDLVLSGADLDNLELAYVLTCHKMQGSQSKVVIITLESGSSPDFINRNMLNTMITRAQEAVCLVGDFEGDDSILNLGRKKASTVRYKDLLSLLIGDNWL